MFLALMIAASVADWVPVRWPSHDPATVELIAQTPVNCLLVERQHWSAPFAAKAAAQNVVTLGIIGPKEEIEERIRTAKELGFRGVVLLGDFETRAIDAAGAIAEREDLALVELPARRGIRFQSGASITGTYQGVWPGIRPVEESEGAHAMPSGAPWIDTNTGFLRYARSLEPGAFWMANTPPGGQIIPVDRYLQVISDAAMVGARWVVALDGDFSRRLLSREAPAVADWKRICGQLAFYEAHRKYSGIPPYGQMAVVQDHSSGALMSGSVLDMIAVKHTPVRPVPGSLLGPRTLDQAAMAVNVDPDSLTPQQKEALRAFTRGGGTVLNGPPGWKMPSTSKNGLTVDREDVEKLDQIWKEMNTMMGRRNLGVRLFNVSSMLSYFQASRDGKLAVLHLVNYSGYPVESVTAHVLGKYKRAWLSTPEGPRKAVETYEVEEGAGTGLDIAIVPSAAIVVLEKE
jgi:hypothetical protein